MKRYFKTLMLALALMPLVGRADQLAWISRADVEKVVKSIQEQIRQRQGEPYYMVSYCSLCDQIPVEVWEVKDVVTVAIPDTDYFQMHVFGRRVLRSAETIREGKYQEPVLYEAVAPDNDNGFLRGVDLAYVYMPSEDGAFRCVGKVFQLECDVSVERINIPQDAFSKAEEKPKTPTKRRKPPAHRADLI